MASISQSSAVASGTPWEHRTAKGIEFGGEVPSGSGPGIFSDFFGALETIWRARKTIWLLVVYDYKSRYRAQSLGMFWSIAHPLLMMGTLTVAFTLILKVPVPNFPVYYLSAGILWHFFTNGWIASTSSLVGGSGFVKTTNLPRYFLPIVAIFSQFINFLTELSILFGLYFVFPTGFVINLTWLFFPVLVFILIVLVVGLGLLTASFYVRYRDTFYVVNSMILVGFWVTPILYDVSMAPAWLANILLLNPLAGIFEGSRQVIMTGRLPEFGHLLPSLLAAGFAFTIGCLVFRKENLTVADYV